MKRLLAFLMLALAALVGFAQTCGLVSMLSNTPPALREFAHSYAITSSIECYGFAFLALIVGIFLLHSRGRFWLWSAFALAMVGLWLFVGREIWGHYVVLPRMRHDFLATHPYFAPAPVWAFLLRVVLHILLPAAVIVAGILCLSMRSSELPSAGAAGSRSP